MSQVRCHVWLLWRYHDYWFTNKTETESELDKRQKKKIKITKKRRNPL